MKIFIILLYLSSIVLSKEKLIKENLIIVANMNFPLSSLSSSQVRQIYLKKVTYIHGFKILPLNRLARDNLRKKFEESILRMSSIRLQKYWMNKHFHGDRPPLVKYSTESIISFLVKVDGSLAYILEGNASLGLKTLYKMKENNSSKANSDINTTLDDKR